MAPDFQKFMTEATRLTQAGDLDAATAMIQQALHRRTFAADGTADVVADDDVIDVEAREVDPRAGTAPAGTPLAPAFHVRPQARVQPEVREPEVREPKAREPGVRDPEVKAPEVQAPPRASPLPDGRFISGRFGHGHAARDFKLFIPPAGIEPGPRPLVVMLHGCTQDPDDFARGTRMNELARAHGFYVLYPAQSQQANPKKCWNWFKHSHQQRGHGEPATLAAMTRTIIAEHGIDRGRVYVAGLSAGGAMAAILGQAYPDLFAAVGIHSGLGPGAAKDLPGALAAMKGNVGATENLHVPAIIFHGDADATVHARNGERLFAGSPGELHTLQSDTVRSAGRTATRRRRSTPDGRVVAEHWVVHGAAHSWSGGDRAGSHTDPAGPDASAEMLRFFLTHRLAAGHG